MNADEMGGSGLGGGHKELAMIAAFIAAHNDPHRYLSQISKYCVEIQRVFEQVEDALLGRDCLFFEEKPPIKNVRDIAEERIERNEKALKILRDWHRRSPDLISWPSSEP